MANNRQSLFDCFCKSIEKNNIVGNNEDCNLFKTIHLSENDHTNILKQILQFKQENRFPFLKSFLENVLGITPNNNPIILNECSTQYPAIPIRNRDGKDPSGFIDLFLKVDEKIIIIENKVCGASDGEMQLLRYYYSFVELKDGDNYIPKDKLDSFKKNYDSYHNPEHISPSPENVFLVYLTKDGKDAEEKSIGKLSICENYIPISYFGEGNDDRKTLLSWLKEDVLPNMPYLKNGNLLQSLLLYIDYLENVVDDSQNDDFFVGLKEIGYNKEIEIKDLIKEYSEYRDYKEKQPESEDAYKIQNQYLKFLKSSINTRLSKILNEIGQANWVIRWTPAYIMLFKQEWFNKYPHTHSICLLHWELLKDMDHTNPDFMWEIHLEGDKLSTIAPKVGETLKSTTKITKSGHIKNAYKWKNVNTRGYVLRQNDNEIKNCIKQLLGDQKFKDITESLIETIDKEYHVYI